MGQINPKMARPTLHVSMRSFKLYHFISLLLRSYTGPFKGKFMCVVTTAE